MYFVINFQRMKGSWDDLDIKCKDAHWPYNLYQKHSFFAIDAEVHTSLHGLGKHARAVLS